MNATNLRANPEAAIRSRTFRDGSAASTGTSARYPLAPADGLAWSRYLRLPIRAGARLAKAGVTSANRPFADPASHDYFQVLIDNLNQDLLTELGREVPGEAYLLAFVRGSAVKDRLELTHVYWPRIVECFALEEVCVELERSYGRATVEALLLRIKKAIYAKLLRARRRLGPSKLLFRIKSPSAEAFSRSNYEAIVTFVNEVSNLSEDTDETVKELFFAAQLGDAERSVKKQSLSLLHRFQLNALSGQIEANFDQFVQMQKQAKCLHPALPMADEAIRRIAEMLRTTPDISRQLMTLFRLAWLCGWQDSQTSDFTLKSLVVIPQPETARAGIHHDAEATLATAFGAMEKIKQSQAELTTFQEIYPEVRVSLSAFLLSLPMPLFETFLTLDSGEDRLDFMTKYQMGPAYFQKHLHALFRDPVYGERIGALDVKYDKRLSNDVISLFDRMIYLKTKTGKKGTLRQETISPLDTSPVRTRELLKNSLDHRDDEYVEQCAGFFNEVAKDDLVGKIRGLWTWNTF
jgi:hypothetical protein